VPAIVDAPFGRVTGLRKNAGSSAYSYTGVDATLAGNITVSYFVRRADGGALQFPVPTSATSGSNDCVVMIGAPVAPSETTVESLGDGWYRLSATRPHTGSIGFLSYRQDVELEVTGLQVELGSRLSRYQRTNTSADYDWRNFPLYLQFDGVDDFLEASPITFGSALLVSGFAASREGNASLASGTFGSSPYYGIVSSTSGPSSSTHVGAGSPTISVDGEPVANTRAQLDAVWGGAKVVRYAGLNLGAWTKSVIGMYTGFPGMRQLYGHVMAPDGAGVGEKIDKFLKARMA